MKIKLLGLALIMLSAVIISDSFAQDEFYCQGLPATIVGTIGQDIIIGTPEKDIIAARDGWDIIYGLGGNDIICGMGGNDKIYSGEGQDIINAGVNEDTCFIQEEDTIIGNSCESVIIQHPLSDIVSEEEPRTLVVGLNKDTYTVLDELVIFGGVAPITEPVPINITIFYQDKTNLVAIKNTISNETGDYELRIQPEDPVWKKPGKYFVVIESPEISGAEASFTLMQPLPETSETFFVSDIRIVDALNPSNTISDAKTGQRTSIFVDVINDQSKTQSIIQRITITGPENVVLEQKATLGITEQNTIKYNFSPVKSGTYSLTVNTFDSDGVSPLGTVLNLSLIVTGTDQQTIEDVLALINELNARITDLENRLAVLEALR